MTVRPRGNEAARRLGDPVANGNGNGDGHHNDNFDISPAVEVSQTYENERTPTDDWKIFDWEALPEWREGYRSGKNKKGVIYTNHKGPFLVDDDKIASMVETTEVGKKTTTHDFAVIDPLREVGPEGKWYLSDQALFNEHSIPVDTVKRIEVPDGMESKSIFQKMREKIIKPQETNQISNGADPIKNERDHELPQIVKYEPDRDGRVQLGVKIKQGLVRWDIDEATSNRETRQIVLDTVDGKRWCIAGDEVMRLDAVVPNRLHGQRYENDQDLKSIELGKDGLKLPDGTRTAAIKEVQFAIGDATDEDLTRYKLAGDNPYAEVLPEPQANQTIVYSKSMTDEVEDPELIRLRKKFDETVAANNQPSQLKPASIWKKLQSAASERVDRLNHRRKNMAERLRDSRLLSRSGAVVVEPLYDDQPIDQGDDANIKISDLPTQSKDDSESLAVKSFVRLQQFWGDWRVRKYFADDQEGKQRRWSAGVITAGIVAVGLTYLETKGHNTQAFQEFLSRKNPSGAVPPVPTSASRAGDVLQGMPIPNTTLHRGAEHAHHLQHPVSPVQPQAPRHYETVTVHAGSGDTYTNETLKELRQEGISNPTQQQIMQRTGVNLRLNGTDWQGAHNLGTNGDEKIKLYVK